LLGLASDGEDRLTNSGGLGMLGLWTVWGSHIDGEGTVVAESLEHIAICVSHFCEFAIGPELATSVAFGWSRGVGHSHGGARHF